MKKSNSADKRRKNKICKDCCCYDCPALKKNQLECKRAKEKQCLNLIKHI